MDTFKILSFSLCLCISYVVMAVPVEKGALPFEYFGDSPLPSDIGGVSTDASMRQAVPGQNKRWTKGIMPYVFDRKYSAADIAVIKKGMELISNVTCITFKPRTNERDYIFFEDYSCAAYVGKTGRGKTTIWMSKAKEHYCLLPEVIAHEIIHAIGLHHEQQRPDRDDYIDVKWDNIDQSNKNWISNIYEKMAKTWSTFGVAYDLDSIMHYPQGILAKNHSKPTMVSKIPGKEVPTRRLPDSLSRNDAEKINRMYNNCK